MKIEWLGFSGLPWNCRVESPYEITSDEQYDVVMEERRIAIDYWLKCYDNGVFK